MIPARKRAAPAEIQPIVSAELIVSQVVSHETGQTLVALIATRKAEGTVVWKTKLFQVVYNEKLEKDVQVVHLKSLALKGPILIAEDEKKAIYKLDLDSGRLLEPQEPVVYYRR